MKKLLFICILISSFNSYSGSNIDGSYTVSSSPCSIFFLAKDGAAILRAFDVGETLNIKTKGRFVSSDTYDNYFIAGLKEISYTHQSSFDRNYKKNSKLRWFVRDNEIKVVQVIKSFKYRVYKDFCNPYDFSGLTCAIGLMNPSNWVSYKKTYPQTKITNHLRFEKDGQLIISRVKSRKDSSKRFNYCELQKN